MTNLLTEDLDETSVPEKFKDPASGAIKVQNIVNSYNALEKKLSAAPSPADMGHVPHAPEEYCIDCAHGMFKPDADVNQRLHAKGLNEEQLQEVYDLAAEKLVPMIAELAAEFQADREIEKLINHFGGADKWKDISRQLFAFGSQNLPPEVLRNLSSSYEGVLALHRMMRGEEPTLRPKEQSQAPGAVGEKELSSMMKDPKYWKDKDPVFVEQVTQGFKSLYGN